MSIIRAVSGQWAICEHAVEIKTNYNKKGRATNLSIRDIGIFKNPDVPYLKIPKNE